VWKKRKARGAVKGNGKVRAPSPTEGEQLALTKKKGSGWLSSVKGEEERGKKGRGKKSQ